MASMKDGDAENKDLAFEKGSVSDYQEDVVVSDSGLTNTWNHRSTYRVKPSLYIRGAGCSPSDAAVLHHVSKQNTTAGDPVDFASEEHQGAVDLPVTIEPPRFLDPEELRAIGRKGDAWLLAHKDLVATLPVGTVIVINVATGAYVHAASEENARAAFVDQFGERTLSFLHRVGRPTTVGGGWWALHEAP